MVSKVFSKPMSIIPINGTESNFVKNLSAKYERQLSAEGFLRSPGL